MAVSFATSSTHSAEIEGKKLRLFEYFEIFGDTPVHNQVYEIADIMNEIVEIRRKNNEAYEEIEYTVGFCKMTVKGLDANLCEEQGQLEIIGMFQRWCGYDVFTLDEDVNEFNGVDDNAEDITEAVKERVLETKNIDVNDAVVMCDSEQSSKDDEFTTESDENESRKINSVAPSSDTKWLDWNDMVEEYEAAEMAKLAEGNEVDNNATCDNVGQRTIFSRFRQWVAKRLRTVTVCCCNGPRGHGLPAYHLPQAM